MINQQLLDPKSIVVIGGSEDVSKPGGKVLENILSGGYKGKLYVVNPKADMIQGVESYRDPVLLPQVELAILAIPAKFCTPTIDLLAKKKGCKAFIVVSAGFGEENEEGKLLEDQMLSVVNEAGACLIGPNCIGFMNSNYFGVFTTPLPKPDSRGVDFISGSGATAVFIMESGIKQGLTFSSVYSVGNAAQTGVEDVLEYMDNEYRHGVSPGIKLLYIENIADPKKLLKHSSSLISKGCKIAALKAGRTEAGSRAASSHTGALSSSDTAVNALFKKAGIVRCYSRSELTNVACVFRHKKPGGRNIAVITHAGGPAVMITDTLTDEGFNVPHLSGEKAEALLEKLHPGSSVANPIDVLATGTAWQIGQIIDACENDFGEIDAMVVIHGSPGLTSVEDVYRMIHDKMRSCSKAIYPVLPSVINAEKETALFMEWGNVFFPDEVDFARAFSLICNSPPPAISAESSVTIDRERIRQIAGDAGGGYLDPQQLGAMLDAAGIPRVKEKIAASEAELPEVIREIAFPVVMKVVGPVHKSDVGGVILDVNTEDELKAGFSELMKIPGTSAVLIQTYSSGIELFAGIKKEGNFGHIIMFGLGGVLIEVIKDVSSRLVPLGREEARQMIRTLKGYKVIRGTRGQKGVNEEVLVEILLRLSMLAEAAPEIEEMDMNPLFGNSEKVFAVDARIRLA